jgi:heptosyltransferase-2
MSRHPDTSDPERILVVRNRFIGDTVLAIPFLRNLRSRFPRAVIDVLVEPGARDVLADCPYIDEIIVWSRPHRSAIALPRVIASSVRLAAKLRRRRYTRAYVLKRSLASGLVVWLAGIARRVGLTTNGKSPLLTHPVAMRRQRHEAELFLDLLRADGIEVDDGHNENWTNPAAVAKVERLLCGTRADRPRVFVAPRSTDERKEWPAERMGRAIRWLVEKRGCEIFLCGGPKDGEHHLEIRAHVGLAAAGHVHDLTADLSLREAGALISRMDLCLGVDTGLPHIAASFGVPTVVLFGRSDAVKWHPWKAPSRLVHSPSQSMLDISVGEVTAAAGELLDEFLPVVSRRPAPTMRSHDLRQGRYRYAVMVREGQSDTKPLAAAEPAAKPLAQAH